MRAIVLGMIGWALLSTVAGGAERIPAKTVVLTFDDAVRSHRTFVAPLLKEMGMGATFFISQRWMPDREHFMSWEEISDIHAMGFEIGNHTWTHDDFSQPRNAARLAGETALVDHGLSRVKVPRGTSFAYPGNAFGPEAVRRLNDLGYRLARRGRMPEVEQASTGPGPAFDPSKHHPLLIPTTGDSVPAWDLGQFRSILELAKEGQAVILQFHGVPDVRHPWVHTPPERFREYLSYLKDNGFRVIAMRDLEPYIDRNKLPKDPTLDLRYPQRAENKLLLPVEMAASRADEPFWMPNMLVAHRYSWEETAGVMGWSVEKTQARAVELGVHPEALLPPNLDGNVRVLPYPGGRHPRTGFLDGAIDPLRGTKVSLLPPWKDGGYVVLDLPEAIFSNLGLTFLAHTHIPTIWNEQNITIENVDWVREPDGRLRNRWALPNGIVIEAEVTPQMEGANFELALTNWTKTALTDLRTQICLMLRGAPGFTEQSQERKEYASPISVAKAKEGERYILLAVERCGRAWGNPPCPCIHADPVLPNAAPGERVVVRGLLRFHEGPGIDETKKRLREEL